MAFRMLTRRGGGASQRMLNVPVASEMATTVVAHQEAEEQERSELKRLVLDQVALAESQAVATDAALYPVGRVLMQTGAPRAREGQGGPRWGPRG
jgi:hypothetical protein